MTLGRTHRDVPARWIRPYWDPTGPPLAEVAAGCVVDISSQPALWGHALRQHAIAGVVARLTLAGHALDVGPPGDDLSVRARRAAELTEAHLIETLSAIGRPCIDFYAVSVHSGWSEATLNGVLEALESARQDGMVGHFGLALEGDGRKAIGLWQMRDAFEFVIAPHELRSVVHPLAVARNVGLVLAQEDDAQDNEGRLSATLIELPVCV